MSTESFLWDILYIPKHHQRCLSSSRSVCLVHDEWLHSLRQKVIKDVSRTRILNKADTGLYLAPSYQTLPRNWSRVCIKVIRKDEHLVQQPHPGPLYNTNLVTSSMEHLSQCSCENFRNMWAAAHVQYTSDTMEAVQQAHTQLTNVVRSYIHKLNPSIYIKLPDDQTDQLPSNYTCHHDNFIGNNIIPSLAVIETKSIFFIIQPYISRSLGDIVSYSPAVFNTSHAKSLFVLYQILHGMISLHKVGLSCGDLTLKNILVDEKLWVTCTYPHLSQMTRRHKTQNQKDKSSTSSVLNIDSSDISVGSFHENTSELGDSGRKESTHHTEIALNQNKFIRHSECENYVEEAKEFVEKFQKLDVRIESLAQITEDWNQHKLSNFKYLMILNFLSGRRLGDPNHHPVLPWVMNFTDTNSGYRDLSMSKFRLNKGDSQLDFTFEAMADTEHIPHHVSDVLSDITYYVYKARRTPKHLLCTYVRTKWVPNEYPISLERMYKWTPDECIPEFFTDPTIFTSIHEDLPDLDLPSWCPSAADFIDRHMAVLESDQISASLHQWIDLTFGYKLSGQSAVRAKNVYLHLVDGHKDLVNHGVVQLFTVPHPPRLTSDKGMSLLPPRVSRRKMTNGGTNGQENRDSVRLESGTIKLPADFDPTAALDHFEALHSFTNRTTESLPPSTAKGKAANFKFSDIHGNLATVWRDIQQFGCVMCELYLASRLQTQDPYATLQQRYNMIGRLCAKDKNVLPRIVHTAADVLLMMENFKENREPFTENCVGPSLLFEYPMVNSLGLPPPTPALLIQSYSGIFPFPEYFAELYSLLNEIKNLDNLIEKERIDMTKTKQEKKKIEKVLSRKKVEVLEKYLRKNRGHISQEGYELLLPYIKELFSDTITNVQAAWSLLGLVGKDLGSVQLSTNLLPYLTRLFNGEDSTPKHMKLYHRSFLVQLMLHLGLANFLSNFCTLLVEAVAGYKDFTVEIDADASQEDIEDEYTDEVFLSNQMEEPIESQDTDLDHQEVNGEDIRPDQTDDDVTDVDVDDDITDDDILNDEFPHLSTCSEVSQSVDSFSTDLISQRSTESDSMVDDESAATDKGSSGRGSSDRASVHSIHSISHIIERSPREKRKQADDISQDQNDTEEATDDQQQPTNAVHFEFDQSDGALSSSNQSKDVYFQTNQSKHSKTPKELLNDSDSHSSSYMIRSETDEFRQIHYSHTINICDVSAESIKWLSHRLGPLLTAKYLSKNLVRMLALCYLGEEQVVLLTDVEEDLPKTTRLIQGDRNAHKVLECLSYVAAVYGEQVILLQYMPCIVDLIHVARRRLTVRAEAGLVAAVVLLRHMVPLLSDKTFLEILQESVINDALRPVLKLVSSTTSMFPSGSTLRSIILYKIVDVLYILGLRLGFEMTRRHMTSVLQTFFKPFALVHTAGNVESLSATGSSTDLRDGMGPNSQKDGISMDESYLNIKMDDYTHQYMIGSPVTLNMASMTSTSPGEHIRKWRSIKTNYSLTETHGGDDRDDNDGKVPVTEETVQSELRNTFSAELALAAYIPLTSVFGSHHMEDQLPNDDLVRKLCAQYDKALYTDNSNMEPAHTEVVEPMTPDLTPEEGDLGSNVAMVGNRICLQGEATLGASPETSQLRKHFQHKGILRIDPEETKCTDICNNKQRHLKGNWLAYWEHELGLNERETMFNFKQIKLQTFVGHNNSIRSLACLDNENSFISASKDKTVKLWSLNSFGDGIGKCRSQWSYDRHKKSVFSVAYVETMRLVASCDSTVHIWDPFTGDIVRQLESSRYSPVIALTPLPSPSTVIMTANTDSTLKFLDLRASRYAHEYKCVLGSAGMIRCITASPDGSWVAVGFTTGAISMVDLNTGMLMGTIKGHESEVIQLKAFNKNTFVSSSFDMNMKLWNVENGKEVCSFKGHLEPVHCVDFYKNQIVSATTSNKIGVHTSVDSQANFSVTKLRSEVFKGVLTSMAILPLNRTLLLGADNGLIRLIC